MKHLLMALLVLFTLSCSSKKEEKDTGNVFAERIFDIWKDIAGKGQSEKQGSEITVNRAELPKEQQMAVYFLPPEKEGENWRWTREDKNKILSSLKNNGKVSRSFELINTSANSDDLQNMRYMAAQQGADTLLLVRGAASVKSNLNTKALTYIALVPMLFVEGNNVESTFSTQAVLWDVRKPYVHLGVETEGEWEMERPLAFRQRDRAVEKSKEEALTDLRQKLNDQLAQRRI